MVGGAQNAADESLRSVLGEKGQSLRKESGSEQSVQGLRRSVISGKHSPSLFNGLYSTNELQP